ncbi:MAG TPA: exodeoxyribonuclease VII large subunit, partial [Acidothermaceae bacterium]
MALESSAEAPIPVRTVANAISQWVGRLGRVWVDGQLTEITRRPGTNTVFFVLRDPAADISL